MAGIVFSCMTNVHNPTTAIFHINRRPLTLICASIRINYNPQLSQRPMYFKVPTGVYMNQLSLFVWICELLPPFKTGWQSSFTYVLFSDSTPVYSVINGKFVPHIGTVARKMILCLYANSGGSDQPARPRRLIWASLFTYWMVKCWKIYAEKAQTLILSDI